VLLTGRPAEGFVSAGPIVCACFSVGMATIRAAIQAGAASAEAIGEALRAGTNCGSCLPELKRLLASAGLAADSAATAPQAPARASDDRAYVPTAMP
jgi:assimilatory nitrate reductase catalytic subunit